MEILVVAALLAPFHGLLHWRLVRAPKFPRRLGLLLVLLWALAVAGFVTGRLLDPDWAAPIAFIGLTWLAVLFYLTLALIPLALLGNRRWAVVLAMALSLGTVGYGVVEAQRVHLVEQDVAIKGLPQRLVGIRIAVASDLHVGPLRGADFTRKVVDLVNGTDPDVVVLPGDLADGSVELVGDDLQPLADLEAPRGVYAVTGNHEAYSDDVGRWLDRWKQLGITPLENDHVSLGGLTLAGVHDWSTPKPYAPDLAKALTGVPDDTVVLLAHQPAQVVDAARAGVDLQISGHTHGGQIWPANFPARWANDALKGLEPRGATQLFTTIGAGAWGPPVRVGARPEVVLLTLRAG